MVDAFLISLDKAIPRTEEETENLFTEELKRKKLKKQKNQRIFNSINNSIIFIINGWCFYRSL
ncbi:MAG: hypothetical protein HC854_08510 [Flavobacterium sp.]|nr:hypothetical protein [Flavobacterium sp.]